MSTCANRNFAIIILCSSVAATINEIDLIFQSQFTVVVVVAVVRLTRFVIFHDYVISISFRAISPTVRLL